MRLSLQSDADVLDWAGHDAVGDTGECAGEIVLRIAQLTVRICGRSIESGELASCVVKGAELDRDLLTSIWYRLSEDGNRDRTHAPIPISGVKVPLIDR